MIVQIIINYIAGLLIGCLLEFSYRSIQSKKFVKPVFVNFQMYGLTGIFLYLISLSNISLYFKILLILIFTTAIEFIIGYSYFKFKNNRLWDYSNQPFNYKGFICPLFSLYWLVISLVYYYLVMTLLITII